MGASKSSLFLCLLSLSIPASKTHNNSELHTSQYRLIMNRIDSCWRSNPAWAANRRSLASCAVGFGSDAVGGRDGAVYVVTDPSDHPVNPQPGTLRYGATRDEPLWIVFARDMSISLKNELMLNSYKTIDGRGARVEIANGPCITIEGISHVIIHGISLHDCKPGKPGLVQTTPEHVSHRQGPARTKLHYYLYNKELNSTNIAN